MRTKDMGKASKTIEIRLDSYGSFLGVDHGCLVVKDKEGKMERYPIIESEVGQVSLTSGNTISTGALTALAFWGVNTVLKTRNGMPIAIIKPLQDDSHVKTRIHQYEAIRNGKGFEIAKRLVIGKLIGENLVLMKYGLEPEYKAIDFVENLQVPSEYSVKGNSEFIKFRNQLLNIEGRRAEYYFNQIFNLFPLEIRPEKRVGHYAYDSLNNCFNLASSIIFVKSNSEQFLLAH